MIYKDLEYQIAYIYIFFSFYQPAMKKKNKETKKKKQKIVKKLVPKAGLAIKNEFYIEASWILSIIIESKLRRNPNLNDE